MWNCRIEQITNNTVEVNYSHFFGRHYFDLVKSQTNPLLLYIYIVASVVYHLVVIVIVLLALVSGSALDHVYVVGSSCIHFLDRSGDHPLSRPHQNSYIF